jgi:hypothetical protein
VKILSRLAILGIGLFVCLAGGCGGGMGDSKPETDPAQEEAATATAPPPAGPCPEWINKLPVEQDYIFAAATETSKDLSRALDLADRQCRFDLERTAKLKLAHLKEAVQLQSNLPADSPVLTRFNQAVDQADSKTLDFASVREKVNRREGDGYRVCLLMQVHRLDMLGALYDVLVADDVLYGFVKDGPAFLESERMVQEHREKLGKESKAEETETE